MDAKKEIAKFAKPNMVPVIILICIPPVLTLIGLLLLLCVTLPANKKVNKRLEQMEANGELERAYAEFTSPNAKHLIKGKLILTEHYIFGKNSGLILTYDEVKWVYKHRFTRSLLFIPISVTDSLYLATKTVKPGPIASMGRDRKEEIKTAIIEIYNHNRNCLVGYTKETVAAYKAMTK